MNQEDAEEYTQALGQVVAGGWRQVALGERLGVPKALGLSTREWVEQRLGGYVRMSIPERREAATELAQEGLKQREIADVLGVDAATVNRDLKPVADATKTPSDVPSTSADADSPDASVADATEASGVADPIFAEIDKPVLTDPPRPLMQTNEGDEWYTPRWLFDALGVKFSLDVCAPLDRTYSSVPAERHLTIEDDGLGQPWEGTVWCNPPYSKPEPWARRMIHHGDGLLLTEVAPVRQETIW